MARIILLLLTSLFPLILFQNISFLIGINEDKMGVKLSRKSMMEPSRENSLRFSAVKKHEPLDKC